MIEVERLCEKVFAVRQNDEEGPQCVIFTTDQVLALVREAWPNFADMLPKELRALADRMELIEKNASRQPAGGPEASNVVQLLPKAA